MASKICFISVSPEATALYKEVLESLPEPPPIFGEDIKGALAAAQTAVRQGYEILITTERTARHLWGHLDTPIVAFPSKPFDIERAVYLAKNAYGGPVAFFESGDPYITSPTVRNILRGNFTEFVYDGREDGLSKLRRAVQEGFHAIVGGATITAMAHEVGIPCVPLLPSAETILKTFQQAQQIASVRQIKSARRGSSNMSCSTPSAAPSSPTRKTGSSSSIRLRKRSSGCRPRASSGNPWTKSSPKASYPASTTPNILSLRN